MLGTNFRIGSVDIDETMFPGLAGENLVNQMGLASGVLEKPN
jgi:hypothetical protein